MKKTIIIHCLFLYALHLYAQSQYNSDSLWSVYNDQKISDTIRFEAMIDLAWTEVMYYRLDSAHSLIQQLIEETRAKGLERYECVYSFAMGFKGHQTGQYGDSENHFKESIALAEKFHMPKVKNWSIMGLADTYGLQNKYEKSIEWYTRSMQFADSINYMELKELSIGNRGIILNKMGQHEKALDDYLWALELSRQHHLPMAEAGLLVLLGNYYRDHESNYPKALDSYLEGEELARKLKYDILWAEALMAIGRLHDRQEDFAKGLEYKLKTLELWQNQANSNGIMWTYNNLAYSYRKMKEFDQAKKFYNLQLQLADETESISGKSFGYYGLGEVAYLQGKYEESLGYFIKTREFDEQLESPRAIAISSHGIGKSLEGLGRSNEAVIWCKEAYKYFSTTQVLTWTQEACLCLYKAYKSLGQPGPALYYFEQVATLNDSLNEQEIGKKMLQMEFSKQMMADSLADVEEALRVEITHAAEISRKNQTRNIYMGSGIMAFLLAGGLWNRLQYTRRSKIAIEVEKERSENLLLNILPYEVAEELKMNGTAAAKHYDMVSILFTDFKNFTNISKNMSAEDLVDEINICFKAFDQIVEKFHVEKIKTIGDAYMAAGGLPVPSTEAAKNTVLAALEIQNFVVQRRAEQNQAGKMSFEMRVGIHTGPVVAGIVGIKKFQYDVWGDTVNTASRMESHGQTGFVNVSESTFELLKDDPEFTFQKREPVYVKGKGQLNMYFVRSSSDIQVNTI